MSTLTCQENMGTCCCKCLEAMFLGKKNTASKHSQQLFRQQIKYLRDRITWTASLEARELLRYISVQHSSTKQQAGTQTEADTHRPSLKKVRGFQKETKVFLIFMVRKKTHTDFISLLLWRCYHSCAEAPLRHKARGC